MIAKYISNLKPGKAVRSNDILTKRLKDFEDLLSALYTRIIISSC